MRKCIFICFIFTFLSGVLSSEHFAKQMTLATYKLFHPKSTSTCFIVQKEDDLILVTTAHSIERMKSKDCLLVLREKLADGTYKRYDHKVILEKDGQPLWIKHEKEDIAVLRFPTPLPHPVEPIQIKHIASEPTIQQLNLQVTDPIC